MDLRTISSTDLAQRADEVVHRIRHGGPAVVRRSGHDEVVLVDALDFRLLIAVANWALPPAEPPADEPLVSRVLRLYLAEEVRLDQVAEALDVPSTDLEERFLRLRIPIHRPAAIALATKAVIEVASKAAQDLPESEILRRFDNARDTFRERSKDFSDEEVAADVALARSELSP